MCVCDLASSLLSQSISFMYIWKFKSSVVLKCFITASIYIILKCLTFSRTHQINWNLKLVAHIIFMTVEEAFLYNDF